MEDEFNILANGRRPQYFGKWKMTSKFSKWKTTNILANGRQPQYLAWWKTTWICGHINGNLNVVGQWKTTSIFWQMEEISMFYNWKMTLTSMFYNRKMTLNIKSDSASPSLFLLFFSSSPPYTFLQKGVVLGLWNCARKKSFWVK